MSQAHSMCGKNFTFGGKKKSQNHNWKKIPEADMVSICLPWQAGLFGACIQPTTITIRSSSTHYCFPATDCTQKWHRKSDLHRTVPKLQNFHWETILLNYGKNCNVWKLTFNSIFSFKTTVLKQEGSKPPWVSISENFILCFQYILLSKR